MWVEELTTRMQILGTLPFRDGSTMAASRKARGVRTGLLKHL